MLPSFISRYFPGAANGHTVAILGLDYSGKATLLYHLKRPGTEITTIPTIGFNVETVAFGKKKLTLWDVGSGCGMRYLYGMLRYYTDHAAGLVWLVDGSDTLRLDESVEEFRKIFVSVDVEKPVLILPSKQDRSLSNTHTLSSWLARTETDVPALEFLEQFQNITLSSWDHYTHIRIAYVILTTFGRQTGKNMIFDGIERFIAQSPLSNGRKFTCFDDLLLDTSRASRDTQYA
ncbi:P-loop containing nucleoside triphosphate hydrolase protein [Hymenopellis radicata]|nr:P-loop containing nucleoside triphosphate hydrolase protein [Hymenopellis radicata]